MAEIVNLRRARKTKRREEAAEQAATNRMLSGRTKAERTAAATQQKKLDRTLDAARIERD